MAGIVFPCAFCGAADSRDARHAQGCPRFAQPSKDELIRAARACERGWADDGLRRAEVEQKEARAEATKKYVSYRNARRNGNAKPDSFEEFSRVARAEARKMKVGRISKAELFDMYQAKFA